MESQTGVPEKARISEADWLLLVDFARAANMRNPSLLNSASQVHRKRPFNVHLLPVYSAAVLSKALCDRFGSQDFILDNVKPIASRLLSPWYKMTHCYRKELIFTIRYAFSKFEDNPLDPSVALSRMLVLTGLVLTSFDEQIWALRSYLEEMIENNSESFLRLGERPNP